MASIRFNYSGNINSQNIDGVGHLCSNVDNGQFTGSIIFASFPASFNPAAAGASLLSISCTNGGASTYDIPNILSLTTGTYTSRRTIDFFEADTTPLGQVIIDGSFTKLDDEIFEANVILSGTYTGATDLIIPSGYDLPLNVTNPTKLQGSFNLDIPRTGGSLIKTTHVHEFEFTSGTTQPLVNCESQIYYMSNSKWNPTNKCLYLPGISIMRNQT